MGRVVIVYKAQLDCVVFVLNLLLLRGVALSERFRDSMA